MKELDTEKVEETFGENKNKNEYFLLKEFDYFRKLIEEMNAMKFKYVSFAYSGYKEIHSFAKEYNIDLLEHGNNCFLCKEEANEKQEKNKKNNRLSLLKFW